MAEPAHDRSDSFDHESHPGFVSYYSEASLSAETMGRFRRIRDNVLRLLAEHGTPREVLRVADVGCGAGTFSCLWAELGHRVFGLDVNRALIELARERARQARWPIQFDVGTAVDLPYDDESMDVVMLPELLEHVADWQSCLAEAARVLSKGGLIYLSTTNVLCPVQDEFSLPMYSWYPAPLKRRYERLAVTTRPELVNHAKYPAVHWFSFFQLRDFLGKRGFRCLDRFDAADRAKLGSSARAILQAIERVSLLRLLGHVATSDVTLYAIKQ